MAKKEQTARRRNPLVYLVGGASITILLIALFLIHLAPWGEYAGIDEQAWLGFWGTLLGAVLAGSVAASVFIMESHRERGIIERSEENHRRERERTWVDRLEELVRAVIEARDERSIKAANTQLNVWFNRWVLLANLDYHKAYQVYDAFLDTCEVDGFIKSGHTGYSYDEISRYCRRVEEELGVAVAFILKLPERGLDENNAEVPRVVYRLRLVHAQASHAPKHAYPTDPSVNP